MSSVSCGVEEQRGEVWGAMCYRPQSNLHYFCVSMGGQVPSTDIPWSRTFLIQSFIYLFFLWVILLAWDPKYGYM